MSTSKVLCSVPNLSKRTFSRTIKNWAKRQINDPYVQMSVRDGYRCRSAYKLLEIEQKFKIFEPGSSVMECGCSPGSWSQVAAKLVNAQGLYTVGIPQGSLVGCDLLYVEPIPGANLLSFSDFTDEQVQKELVQEVFRFDVVISDMAPNASGQKSLDHSRIMNLAGKVRDFSLQYGRFGSSMIVKVWDGIEIPDFVKKLEQDFNKVHRFKPKASRSESAEIYIIALGLLNSQ